MGSNDRLCQPHQQYICGMHDHLLGCVVWTDTDLLKAIACAPGHRLEETMAAAYCGTKVEVRLADQAGRPLTSIIGG